MGTPTIRSAVCTIALVALAAAPLAAEEVIRSGVDLWSTVGTGVTYASFAEDPIPAGFFCAGSKPFTGKIAFRGVPVATNPTDCLGQIDTIVRRLDDARFDAAGAARTRIQLLALSLASARPVETECGAFDVAVSLDGEQPTTEMTIQRADAAGGTYSAPLALRTKVVFTPLDGNGTAPLKLAREIEMEPAPNSVWSYALAASHHGPVWVDTDGDREPDSLLPPASNFLAGIQYAAQPYPAPGPVPTPVPTTCGGYPVGPNCPPGTCPSEQCHCTPCNQNPKPGEDASACNHEHCIVICLRDCGVEM